MSPISGLLVVVAVVMTVIGQGWLWRGEIAKAQVVMLQGILLALLALCFVVADRRRQP